MPAPHTHAGGQVLCRSAFSVSSGHVRDRREEEDFGASLIARILRFWRVLMSTVVRSLCYWGILTYSEFTSVRVSMELAALIKELLVTITSSTSQTLPV